MRRSPLRRSTARRRPRDPGAYLSAREVVFARAGSVCEVCGARLSLDTMHAHHRRPRSAGRDDDPSNLLALCRGCHDAVHGNPALSYDTGRLIRRSDLRAPARVPVALRSGWVLLSPDGARTLVP